MTIDIIEAAKADRQTKLDQILALKLDVIEIDAFIAKARAYAGDSETAPESTTPETSNSGASEAETGDLRTTPLEDEIPATPQPVEADEPVAVPQPTPDNPEPSQYDKVVAVLRENRDATIREICETAGVPRGTASVYRGRALSELYPASKAKPKTAPKPTPAPVETKKPEPAPAPFQTPVRNIPVGPAKRPSGKTTFRLRNEEGLYLHSDLNAMLRKGLRFVSKRDYPWTGTEQQMLAVRKMLPETIDLKEEVIQP